MKRILSVFLILSMLCSGCGMSASANSDVVNASSKSDSSKNSTGDNSDNSDAAKEADFAQDASDMFTDRDYEIGYDESESVHIQLNGDSVSCDSDSVKISGTTATITDEGTYIISGTLEDGMVVVNAGDKDKPQLVLNGVSINSQTSAPVYILEADKVFITLAADTDNTLSNGGSYTAVDESNIDSVIFSKEDLTLNGSGTLTVISPAGHGIVSKDDLAITSGTYTINAASHGLDANDSVRIANADMTIHAGKDGIHAENTDDDELGFIYLASGTFDISAEGDGISAGAYMQISDGDFKIVSGGGSENASKQSSDSLKAIKAAGAMLIGGGTFDLDSADDAVHSNTSIVVNGGEFEIATGDDGFHSDESLTVTGGTIHITESYEGLEALNLEISGGDITLTATDDGLNAAGGTDSSGFDGPMGNDNFGRPMENGNFGGMRGNRDFGEPPESGSFGGSEGNERTGGRRGGGRGNDSLGAPAGNENFGGAFDGNGGGGFGGGRGSSSDGTIVISGGNLYIKAYGDGIDANGTLEISGGSVTVCGPTQGDTATLDYDVSGVITGGTFIGTGASGMAQSFSSSEQGVIALKVGNQSAGTQIILKDQSGNTLVSYEPELPFAVVILSSPKITKGETYTLTIGSSTEEYTAN